RPVGRGRRRHDRERLLQGSLQGAAHGVRRGGAAPARHQSGRQCWINSNPGREPGAGRKPVGERGRKHAMLEIKNLHASVEGREREGVFVAFQYPVAIRGITNAYFLRSAVNAIRKHRGEEELGPVEFMDRLEDKLQVIGWDSSYLSRPVNDGFSGGEKKRNEILQMAVLEPKLAILDETDSGL